MNVWKQRGLSFWRNYGKAFLFMLVTVTAFRSSVADWNHVPTGSMEPSILIGDTILVNKLAYDLKVPYTTWRITSWDEPARGDVVVFYSPVDGTRLVKRVVAVGGDTVQMVDGRLIVNGTPATYVPLAASVVTQLPPAARAAGAFAVERIGAGAHPVMAQPNLRATRDFGPVAVPPGHSFVLGDNRDVSFDSRFFGPVPMDRVLGRAPATLTSVDKSTGYHPRWRRFFDALP